jgi:hypothetical protein
LFFVLGYFFLGGDALNGCVKDGHYYLWGSRHGELIEVSETKWKYSYFHGLSIFFTHPTALILMYLKVKSQKTNR